jgi:biopolymer transport protein ExbB
MLAAFQAGTPLAEIGTLTGGLWSALVTTAGGLITGIPAYAAYHFLIGRIESIAVDMEQASADILYFLAHLDPAGASDES